MMANSGEAIFKKWDMMSNEANNWRTLWQECADWAQPTKDNILRLRLQGQEKPPQRIIDSCIEANNAFAAGMYANLFPPNIKWCKFKATRSRRDINQDEVEWYETISAQVVEILRASNFDQEMFECLLDNGSFGTICMYVEESADKNKPLIFRSFSVPAMIRIMANNEGRIDTVGRQFFLDSRQALQEFGEEALNNAELQDVVEKAKHGNTEDESSKIEFIHVVCPRSDRDTSKIDKGNKPFASYYIHASTKKIVKEGGYDYMPYFIGRWSVGNSETYGRSPMMDVLATTRSMNQLERNVIIGTELRVGPQWLLPDDGSVKNMSTRPNARIYWRATNPNSKPQRLDPSSDVGIGIDMLERKEAMIKRFFYNQLFRPLEDYRNMTAWEAMERTKTDMMILSPFIGRLQDEFISPMLQYIFQVLQKAGLLEDPPESMNKADFEIEYVTRLAQSTRTMEIQGSIETVRQIGELGQIYPPLMASLDNIDPDIMFKELWYGSSASMSILRGDSEVENLREAQAIQAKKEAEMQELAIGADAAQKMGKTPEEGSPTANYMDAQ